MTRLFAFVVLGGVTISAAVNDGSACPNAIEGLVSGGPKKQLEFAKLSLATGKSLPHDAGKYVMCMDSEHTRYFLVKMDASMPGMGKPVPIELGFCVPDVCDHAGISALMQSDIVKKVAPVLALIPALANITATSPQLDMKPEDNAGIVVAVVVSLLALLVVISSMATLAKQPQPLALPSHARQNGQQLLPAADRRPAKLPLIIEAFSLFGKSGTIKKLIEIPDYKPTDSLNGLRVVSMAWIILGHTFLMPMGISGYTNQEDIIDSPLNKDTAERNPLFCLITSAQIAVDSFFFLSGFLLSHLTLKELARGKLKILSAVILRYLRLTPSLALVTFVFWKVWVFFGYGPFAPRFQDSINRRCDGSWWSEITYSMNFAPFDSDKVCMGWSWYLGDDMIFFILSLFILPIYHRSRTLGWVCILALTAMSFGVTGWLIVKYNLSIYVFDDHWKNYAYWAYNKPYTRVPAYFVGVMAAWLLAEMEQRDITRETRSRSLFARISATITAGFAGAIILVMIFVVQTDFGAQKNTWGSSASVSYLVFSRPVWAMCHAAITLLCYYDYLPIVNGFLAHPCWTPFARLTYGAYLVHPMVIKLSCGRALQYFTFNSWDMMYRAFGNFVMAYTGSVLLWVLVERPCMTIFAPPRKAAPKKESPADSAALGQHSNPDVPTSSSDNYNAGASSPPLKSGYIGA